MPDPVPPLGKGPSLLCTSVLDHYQLSVSPGAENKFLVLVSFIQPKAIFWIRDGYDLAINTYNSCGKKKAVRSMVKGSGQETGAVIL